MSDKIARELKAKDQTDAANKSVVQEYHDKHTFIKDTQALEDILKLPSNQFKERMKKLEPVFERLKQCLTAAIQLTEIDHEAAKHPRGYPRLGIDAASTDVAHLGMQAQADFLKDPTATPVNRMFLHMRKRFSKAYRTTFLHSTLRELLGLKHFCREALPLLPRNLNYILYFDCTSLGKKELVSQLSRRERGTILRILTECYELLAEHSIFTIHTGGSGNPADTGTRCEDPDVASAEDVQKAIDQLLGKLNKAKDTTAESPTKIEIDGGYGAGTAVNLHAEFVEPKKVFTDEFISVEVVCPENALVYAAATPTVVTQRTLSYGIRIGIVNTSSRLRRSFQVSCIFRKPDGEKIYAPVKVWLTDPVPFTTGDVLAEKIPSQPNATMNSLLFKAVPETALQKEIQERTEKMKEKFDAQKWQREIKDQIFDKFIGTTDVLIAIAVGKIAGLFPHVFWGPSKPFPTVTVCQATAPIRKNVKPPPQRKISQDGEAATAMIFLIKEAIFETVFDIYDLSKFQMPKHVSYAFRGKRKNSVLGRILIDAVGANVYFELLEQFFPAVKDVLASIIVQGTANRIPKQLQPAGDVTLFTTSILQALDEKALLTLPGTFYLSFARRNDWSPVRNILNKRADNIHITITGNVSVAGKKKTQTHRWVQIRNKETTEVTQALVNKVRQEILNYLATAFQCKGHGRNFRILKLVPDMREVLSERTIGRTTPLITSADAIEGKVPCPKYSITSCNAYFATAICRCPRNSREKNADTPHEKESPNLNYGLPRQDELPQAVRALILDTDDENTHRVFTKDDPVTDALVDMARSLTPANDAAVDRIEKVVLVGSKTIASATGLIRVTEVQLTSPTEGMIISFGSPALYPVTDTWIGTNAEPNRFYFLYRIASAAATISKANPSWNDQLKIEQSRCFGLTIAVLKYADANQDREENDEFFRKMGQKLQITVAKARAVWRDRNNYKIDPETELLLANPRLGVRAAASDKWLVMLPHIKPLEPPKHDPLSPLRITSISCPCPRDCKSKTHNTKIEHKNFKWIPINDTISGNTDKGPSAHMECPQVEDQWIPIENSDDVYKMPTNADPQDMSGFTAVAKEMSPLHYVLATEHVRNGAHLLASALQLTVLRRGYFSLQLYTAASTIVNLCIACSNIEHEKTDALEAENNLLNFPVGFQLAVDFISGIPNKQYPAILVAADGNSQNPYIRPVRNMTMKSAAQALAEIYKATKERWQEIRCDNGFTPQLIVELDKELQHLAEKDEELKITLRHMPAFLHRGNTAAESNNKEINRLLRIALGIKVDPLTNRFRSLVQIPTAATKAGFCTERDYMKNYHVFLPMIEYNIATTPRASLEGLSRLEAHQGRIPNDKEAQKLQIVSRDPIKVFADSDAAIMSLTRRKASILRAASRQKTNLRNNAQHAAKRRSAFKVGTVVKRLIPNALKYEAKYGKDPYVVVLAGAGSVFLETLSGIPLKIGNPSASFLYKSQAYTKGMIVRRCFEDGLTKAETEQRLTYLQNIGAVSTIEAYILDAAENTNPEPSYPLSDQSKVLIENDLDDQHGLRTILAEAAIEEAATDTNDTRAEAEKIDVEQAIPSTKRKIKQKMLDEENIQWLAEFLNTNFLTAHSHFTYMKIWNIAGLRRMFRARQCLSKLFRDIPVVIALQEVHRRDILSDMQQLRKIRQFYDIDYNVSGVSNSPKIPEKPTMGVMTLTRHGHKLEKDTQICQELENVHLKVVDSLGIFDDPFKEGRVTTVVTQLTANVKLAVINVYVVNSKWSFERRDQRAEFMLRLQQYVAAVQECGYAIALVGDFNAVTAETDIHPEIVPIRDEVPSLSQAEQTILTEFVKAAKMQQLKHKNPAVYSFYPPDRGHNRKLPHNEGFTLDFVFHKNVTYFNRLSIERCQRFDHQTLVVYLTPEAAKDVKIASERIGMPTESAKDISVCPSKQEEIAASDPNSETEQQ